MHFERLKHAACSAKTSTATYIVVTGSLISTSMRKAEMYDVAKNTWTVLPDM